MCVSSVCVSACKGVHVMAYVCACTCVCVCVYVHACECMCVYGMSVCTCVHLCVYCMYGGSMLYFMLSQSLSFVSSCVPA